MSDKEKILNVRFWFLIVGLFFYGAIFAQNVSRNTAQQAHGWYNYFGNHKIAKRWSVHTELQWRRSDVIANPQQLLMRYGIDFLAHRHLTVTAGYGFIQTYPYGEFPVANTFNEHRFWQTITLRDEIDRFYFNHRLRTEQRWLEEKKFYPSIQKPVREGWLYANRIRYRFMVNIPFNKKEMSKGAVFLSVQDEVFINFGKTINYNIFDQNRLYGGLGYQFVNNGNIQLGYMNQLLEKPDGIRFESNHTLVLSLTYNIDFTKLKKETTSQ